MDKLDLNDKLIAFKMIQKVMGKSIASIVSEN